MGNEIIELAYNGCSSPEEVDERTARRINALHGKNIGDELKNVRYAILAVFSLLRPGIFTLAQVQKFMTYGDKLLSLNAKIEATIEEGRAYKKAMGWQE